MNKPKLTQKHGGYVCSNDEIVRWAETPEEAYAEYQRAYVEIGTMKMKIKQHCVAQIPLHKMTQGDTANIEAVDYTRPAYSSYDIYENENDTTELRPSEFLKMMACVAVCSFIAYLIVC